MEVERCPWASALATVRIHRAVSAAAAAVQALMLPEQAQSCVTCQSSCTFKDCVVGFAMAMSSSIAPSHDIQ